MHRTTAVSHHSQALPLPRGWIILSAALMSWVLFAAVLVGAGQLFSFVIGAI